MRASEVANVLRSMGLPDKAGPLGFDLGEIKQFYGLGNYRLERGSGIAGRGHLWRLVPTRSNGYTSEPCRNQTQLRRVLREWMAGPKPLHPGNWYAKLNKKAVIESYIWVRRGKTPSPEDCTCPKECDCQSPETEPAMVSNLCPIHNLYLQSAEDCPFHRGALRVVPDVDF